MTIRTGLTRRLGLCAPIFQAPMGGVTTAELVASACEAGALGFIAAAYLTPAQIAEISRAVRARTSRPFGINVFAPMAARHTPRDPRHALERLAPYHAELRLAPPAVPCSGAIEFDEQLDAALESGAAVLSFTFGLLPPAVVRRVKAREMFLMGTATTVSEAIALEHSEVDAVVAQGSEAGAHRGSFATEFDDAMIGGIALVPQIVDAVSVPVVASGGIMDGRGVAAALALGASGVQMGTAFLTCDEARIAPAYKQAILNAREDETRVTRAFSGRPARGIVNRFMREVEEEAVLDYPIQNALTRPLRAAAAEQNRAEFLSLWAGQGVRLARRQSVAALIERLNAETEVALERLQTLRPKS